MCILVFDTSFSIRTFDELTGICEKSNKLITKIFIFTPHKSPTSDVCWLKMTEMREKSQKKSTRKWRVGEWVDDDDTLVTNIK